MSAENTLTRPQDTPLPSSSDKRTLTRRKFLRNLLTVGSGSALTYSFYKSSQIVRELEATQDSLESNEYWSERTPGALPEESDRLRQKKDDLTQKFGITMGSVLLSGTLFIADLRARKPKTPSSPED